MRLQSLALENYKSFDQRVEIEIRPLTLLFGYNNAGKSALVRSLPLLAASTEEPGFGELNLDSPVVRSASFSEIACKRTTRPEIAIGLTWTDGARKREYGFTIRDFDGVQRIISGRLHPDQGGPISFDWDAQRATKPDYDHYVLNSNGAVTDCRIEFTGIVPKPALTNGQRAAFDTLETDLMRLSLGLHWLTALRQCPDRLEAMPNTRWIRVLPDGTGTSALLAQDAEREGTLLALVSEWYRKATGHRLEILKGAIANRRLFSLVLIPETDAPIQIPMADAGEGMAQVVSVITLLARAKLNQLSASDLMVVEHPELHLHPQAHVQLAELMCQTVAARDSPVCIVETHSESFLLSVQLAIARGEIPARDVMIYWVTQEKECASTIQQITLDGRGYPETSNWPPGVFREAAVLAKLLYEVRNPHKHGQ